MNIFWNLANLGLSGLGYYNSKVELSPLDLASSIRRNFRFQKIILFNAGLDIAYIAGGFYLLEKAKYSQ